MKRRTSARTQSAIVAALAAVTLVMWPATPAAAVGHARIEGTGSSWSANALNQWVADVQQQGMKVDFTPTGSATGRHDFANGANDFAISDIGFRGSDPKTGEADTNKGRAYAYLPIVAGGTAFPYQVRVGGQLVRNLRLSGETLAKIFTGKITNWNDPQITSDNNGRKLPSLQITVVVHSEGSGSTAQFTSYLAKQYPALWQEYNGNAAFTEYFPTIPNGKDRFPGRMVPQNGSDGVMNTVTAGTSNGAIGYDEYSYALSADYPVVKIENVNGYFTAPTAYNVAVALTKANIIMDKNSPDYLLQQLDQVYVNPDLRTYPLSSYSYMILPTGGTDGRMSSEKRQTLVDFMSYSICGGQQSIGVVGYSPLPINLVNAGFEQLKKLKDVDPAVSFSSTPVASCNNPTFIANNPNGNHLADIAPKPLDCDKRGAGPCAAGATNQPGSSNGGNNGGGNNGGGNNNGSGGGAGNGAAAGPGASSSAATEQVDPDTGEVVSGGGGGGGSGGDANAVGVPNDLAAFKTGKHMRVLGPTAAVLVLLIVFLPTLLGRWLRRRREES